MDSFILLAITDDDGNTLYRALLQGDAEQIQQAVETKLAELNAGYNVETSSIPVMTLDAVVRDPYIRDYLGDIL